MDNYKQLYEKTNKEYKGFYPLTDILSIIDKESGKNLKQLLNQYNHIKLDWKGNAVDTRNSVPLILRHKGLFITYDTGSNIVTEYYTGNDISVSINAIWQNDNNWANFSVAAGLADQEDITEVNGKFKFANRNYNAAQFTGMGKVILRKNLVDVGGGTVKNVLTQNMINKPNTIYEIRYDFDLNGEEITIPEGCVLDFQGGSLSNGIVCGSYTKIVTPLTKIFDNIVIKSNWDIPVISSAWFKNVENENNIRQVFNLANDNVYNIINLENKTFNINLDSDNVVGISIPKNTHVNSEGVFNLLPNNLGEYIIVLIEKDDIVFSGGSIIGDMDKHTGTTGEWGHGICVTNNAKNIEVRNIEITKCWGDGINIAGDAQNVLVENCYIHDCGRLGLSVTFGSYITINNCKIENITRTDPKACIDIEPNSNNEARHIVINSCTFSNAPDERCVIITSLSAQKFISDIAIENCEFNGSSRAIQIHNRTDNPTMKNFIVRNNNFNEVDNLGIYFNRLENLCFENNNIISVNKVIEASYEGILYFNECKTAVCKNNKLFSYLNGISLIYEDNTLHEIKITNNIIDAYGFAISNQHANIENNRITLYSPINLYGCWKNNIIKTSTDFTGRVINLIDRGSLINNTIEINSTNEVIPVYCRGYNIVKDNTFISNVENTNIPNVIGSVASASKVVCINNNFDNINSINNYIAEDVFSNGRYYIEQYNKKWGSNAPENPEGGASYYNDAVKSPMWYHVGRDIWVNSQGVDMDGVTTVLGNNADREAMQLAEKNRGLQYFDTTLNKPIWWTGTKWVDATGADV